MMASLHVFAEDMQKNREREAARAVIMRTVPSLAASPEKLHLETIEKKTDMMFSRRKPPEEC
ncbi:hypothetical protein M5E88_00620 [Akkermansia muciniphila]|nr:hypothetical protein M5E88_00620 [Akkermansia muciniphila]